MQIKNCNNLDSLKGKKKYNEKSIFVQLVSV